MSSGIAIVTAGTTLSKTDLGLLDALRFDSADLMIYPIPPAQIASRIALGQIDASVVDQLRTGGGPAWLRTALAGWTDIVHKRVRYVPSPLGPAGGDGRAAQVAVACIRLQDRLWTGVDELVTRVSGGRERPPVELTILTLTTARTSGRGALAPLADAVQRAHARSHHQRRQSILLAVLPGLPEEDARVLLQSLAGTTASLLEMSAMARVLRDSRGAPVGPFTFGSTGRVADHILLVEPTAAGLRDVDELETWAGDLFREALAITPTSAGTALVAKMATWEPLTHRSSAAGHPAIFASLGFALVDLDQEGEAWRLAIRDARTMLDELLALAEDEEPPSLDDVVGDRDHGSIEALLAEQLDPNGEAEAEVPLPGLDLPPLVNREALRIQEQAVLDRDGALDRLDAAADGVNLTIFEEIRDGLVDLGASSPFALGAAILELVEDLHDRADTLNNDADERVAAAERELERSRNTVLGADSARLRQAANVERCRRLGTLIRERRRQRLAELSADALDFAAERLQASDGPSGPSRIVIELSKMVKSGFVERQPQPDVPRRSTASASFLDKHADAVADRFALALGDDGALDEALAAEILEETAIPDLLLRTLEGRSRVAGRRRPVDVAEEIVTALTAALVARHRQQLASIRTLPDAIDTFDPDGTIGIAQELRDLLTWALNRAAPPIALRDAATIGAPEPQVWTCVEVDSPRTTDLLRPILPAGITLQVNQTGAGGRPRLAVLRTLTGISADCLHNFLAPSGTGWQAYQRLQKAWEAGEPDPLHTLPDLEVLAQRLLSGEFATTTLDEAEPADAAPVGETMSSEAEPAADPPKSDASASAMAAPA